MTKLRIFLSALGLCLAAHTAGAQGYVVVVNAANPVSSISKDRANAIFLKRVNEWDNGTRVVPVNLPRESSVRDAFTRQVHGRSVNAVESYWQQQIFAGKEAPPVTRASEADVLAFVRANAGAVGYVSPGASLGSDVKAVPVN